MRFNLFFVKKRNKGLSISHGSATVYTSSLLYMAFGFTALNRMDLGSLFRKYINFDSPRVLVLHRKTGYELSNSGACKLAQTPEYLFDGFVITCVTIITSKA